MYVFSESTDVHGCIHDNKIRASQGFEWLGLKLSTRDVGTELGLDYSIGKSMVFSMRCSTVMQYIFLASGFDNSRY